MNEKGYRSSAKIGGGIPLDLSRFTLDPNRRIFFTSLTLVNKPGALASTLSLLAKHEINILGIISESISKKEVIEVSMFLEVPEKEVDALDLERKLRDEINKEKIEVVKELKVFEHLKGFDADVYHFPLTVGPVRVVVFPLPVLVAMVKNLRTSLNPTAVQTILWYMGKEVGSSMKEGHERAFAARDIDSVLALLRADLALLGWSLVEIVNLDEEKRSATLRLFDNWECGMFKGSSEPQSHLIRGLLAGFFSSLFKVEVEAKETKCIAKGDPYCEFEVKEKKETKTI
jgi:predicted hydrocarbon binding protein/predicted amino acid-binding ACT domain protein